jgi:hypothetical protein
MNINTDLISLSKANYSDNFVPSQLELIETKQDVEQDFIIRCVSEKSQNGDSNIGILIPYKLISI